jgi:hypothetical protein
MARHRSPQPHPRQMRPRHEPARSSGVAGPGPDNEPKAPGFSRNKLIVVLPHKAGIMVGVRPMNSMESEVALCVRGVSQVCWPLLF